MPTSSPTRRTAIITGAASGLGRALAVRLGRDGWTIALADINPAGAEETKKLVETAGGEAFLSRSTLRILINGCHCRPVTGAMATA